MGSIKRILCAVDFSEATPSTAAYARELAKTMDAQVLVVFAAQSLSRYMLFNVPESSAENLVQTVMSSAKEQMDEVLLTHFQDVNAEGLVETGYPAEVILSVAEGKDCDLIVMGTHGRSGWDRIMFGSVAEKVVKASRIPVLTVPPKQRGSEKA
jgi:nucleotide-binding universal stress UspA family protein